jgi:SAM-dependent methyltransferase
MMKRIHRTWNDFWGPLLMVRFHEDNPKRWDLRRSKAEWLFENLNLKAGAHILDLGCGDGILDICLAELGAVVIGVDRLSSVLNLARAEEGASSVDFREADLRSYVINEAAYDLVLLLEVVGLMGKEDDLRLISKIQGGLRKGGKLLIDCPREPTDQSKSWTQEFPDGVLKVADSYDVESRMQHIDVQFNTADGDVLDLWDPYDPSRGPHSGVMRYLYSSDELRSMLCDAGFQVKELKHFSSREHYLIEATA